MPNNDYIQNPDHLNRAKGQYVAAAAMLEQGFTSEAQRKDAIDLLNRAYDILVKEGINYALWSQRTRAPDGSRWVWDNQTAKDLDEKHNIPDLHVWNFEKHGELYAAFPEQVGYANALKTQRDVIKGAQLVARKPSRTSVKREARNAVAKTCQICARKILAERGNIAHHGYQRPGHGSQTTSCYGAMHPPFEISRDALGSYISIIQSQLKGLIDTRKLIADEKMSFIVKYYTGEYQGLCRVVKTFNVSRENYDEQLVTVPPARRHQIPKTFDEAKAEQLKYLDREIIDTGAYLNHQMGRFASWKAVA